MTTICVIPGDGVGQEVIPAAVRVLSAIHPELNFVEAEAGWECFLRRGTALPDETVAKAAAADAILFGATQSPSEIVEGYASPILALRRRFDLYANLRPTLSLLPDHPPVDLLVVRENSEGLYSGRERREGDVAIAERVVTRAASERIARVAFEQALIREEQRARAGDPIPPLVTIVHKANVLKQTDGLFRESCLSVAAAYRGVQAQEMLVDAAAMWLAKDAARFDVLVTTNLFGDILSDLAAGLVGGLGLAPSANVGDGAVALFEPVHGSAPDIAGQGIANPSGALLASALLLQHLGLAQSARRLQDAVAATLQAGVRTPDLGGEAGTGEVVEAILGRVGWSNGVGE